jgi:hypothetical protein
MTESGAEEERSAADRVKAEADESLETLSGGRAIGPEDARLPLRAIAAIAIFVVTFLLVYLVLWALLGGLGLALGWAVALLAAVVAVRLFTKSRDG